VRPLYSGLVRLHSSNHMSTQQGPEERPVRQCLRSRHPCRQRLTLAGSEAGSGGCAASHEDGLAEWDVLALAIARAWAGGYGLRVSTCTMDWHDCRSSCSSVLHHFQQYTHTLEHGPRDLSSLVDRCSGSFVAQPLFKPQPIFNPAQPAAAAACSPSVSTMPNAPRHAFPWSRYLHT
jgi:hypothetical protein